MSTVQASSTLPRPDCLGCRITGTVVFSLASGYLLLERARLPLTGGHPGHRALLAGLAVAFAGAAAYKAAG